MSSSFFARVLAAMLSAAVLTACGSSSHSVLPAAATASGAAVQTVTITIKIPPATSSSALRPKYISASTQSGSVTVIDSTGQRAPVIQNVAGSTITLKAVALPGNDTFSITLYDLPNGTGKILSVAQTTQKIVAGVANAFTVINGGVVARFDLSLANQFPPSGTALTQALNFSAKDADNNVIIGPFDNPVVLADSDTSGATTLSATSVTASDTKVNLVYNGSSTLASATVSASTTSSATAANATGALGNVTLTPQTSYSGLRLYAVMQNTAQVPAEIRQYKVQSGVGVGTQLPSLNFGALPYGAAPMAAAHDGNGQIYVSINTLGIEMFSQPAVGNATPSSTLTAASIGASDLSRARGLSVDRSGNIFVANAGGDPSSGASYLIYRIAPNGVGGYNLAAQITAIDGFRPYPNFAQINPVTGNLYVSYYTYSGVRIGILSPTANGSVTSLDYLTSGTSTFGYNFAAFTSDGTLYTDMSYYIPSTSEAYTPAVFAFAPGAGKNSLPSRVIYGTAAGLNGNSKAPGYVSRSMAINGIAIDPAGYMYLGITYFPTSASGTITNVIEVFSPTANGNVAPIQTITLGNCNCNLRDLQIF